MLSEVIDDVIIARLQCRVLFLPEYLRGVIGVFTGHLIDGLIGPVSDIHEVLEGKPGLGEVLILISTVLSDVQLVVEVKLVRNFTTVHRTAV